MDKTIQEKFSWIACHLDEKARRLWCANEAMVIGWGGISHVSESTGVSRTTITEGIKELNGKKKIPQGKIRQQGGGRKKKAESHPEIKESLESFLEPYTRGDPMTPLKWTCKSTRNLSRAMKKQGCDVSHSLIARELDDLGKQTRKAEKAHRIQIGINSFD